MPTTYPNALHLTLEEAQTLWESACLIVETTMVLPTMTERTAAFVADADRVYLHGVI